MDLAYRTQRIEEIRTCLFADTVDAEWIALRMASASCRRRISQSRPAVQIGSAAARMSHEAVTLAALGRRRRWLCARAATAPRPERRHLQGRGEQSCDLIILGIGNTNCRGEEPRTGWHNIMTAYCSRGGVGSGGGWEHLQRILLSLEDICYNMGVCVAVIFCQGLFGFLFIHSSMCVRAV